MFRPGGIIPRCIDLSVVVAKVAKIICGVSISKYWFTIKLCEYLPLHVFSVQKVLFKQNKHYNWTLNEFSTLENQSIRVLPVKNQVSRYKKYLSGCVSVSVAVSRDLPFASHVMVAYRLPPAITRRFYILNTLVSIQRTFNQ